MKIIPEMNILDVAAPPVEKFIDGAVEEKWLSLLTILAFVIVVTVVLTVVIFKRKKKSKTESNSLTEKSVNDTISE